ncbi:MAG: CopG family transcriptional regulator [Candidatus Pacebacteria bacterium]|nr:CopG family transcriptional regulator [Candidatus Paceibacterota bacterium]
MSKTITMRVDDDIYQMFKKAAHGARRTISNFLEYATISYLSQETYISDSEMKEITKDKDLMKSLKLGEKEIKEGSYKIVC